MDEDFDESRDSHVQNSVILSEGEQETFFLSNACAESESKDLAPSIAEILQLTCTLRSELERL